MDLAAFDLSDLGEMLRGGPWVNVGVCERECVRLKWVRW